MDALKQNCEICEHFDGDAFCALPAKERLISGHLVEPESIVCVKWEQRESDRQDEIRHAIEAEDAAIERDRYARYPRY